MGTSLTTPKYAFRYPAGLVGEAPDVPDDIHKLALDLESFVTTASWFPTLGGAGAAIGTSSASSGSYVQIQKHVSAKGRIVFGSSASFGTGLATVSSLPGTISTSLSVGYGIFIPTSGNPVPVLFQPVDGANMTFRPIRGNASGTMTDLANAYSIGTPAQSSILLFTLDLVLA